MLSSKSDIENPVLSVITVGLCSAEIITTLHPLVSFLNDSRVEFIVVTPLHNIDSVSHSIAAVFVPDQGEGVYQAMNLGISASSGDYLWFLNSGDESLLSSADFVSLIGYLASLRSQVVSSTLLFFGLSPHQLYKNLPPLIVYSLLKALLLLSVMPLSHQNILFPRLWHKPFSAKYKYSCDFEVLAMLIVLSRQVVLISSPCPIASLSAGGISDVNRLDVFKERFRILLSLTGNLLLPIVVFGYLVRSFRELAASSVKLVIYNK